MSKTGVFDPEIDPHGVFDSEVRSQGVYDGSLLDTTGGAPSNQEIGTAGPTASWVEPTVQLKRSIPAIVVSASWTTVAKNLTAVRNFSGVATSSSWTVVAKDVTPGSVSISTAGPHSTWTVPAGTFSTGGSPQEIGTAGPHPAWNLPSVTLKLSIPATAVSASWSVQTPVLKRSIPAVAVSAQWVVPSGSFVGGLPTNTQDPIQTFGPWKRTKK